MAVTKDEIIEAIKAMPALELSELVKELEDTFGVSAAAPVMMGAMPAAGGAAEPAEETSFVPDAEEDEFQVVRTKKFPIKPMTVDEAILQMDLLGHNFFAFKNEDSEAFAVVYRRNGGGYGLIEDEG